MTYTIVDNDLLRCQGWVTMNYGAMGSEFTAAIGLERDGDLIAVTGYNHFNGKSCHTHFFMVGSYAPRSYVWYVHYYPFIQNGLDKLIAIVSSANDKIIRLAEHLGYVFHSAITGAHKDGDLLIYVMEKENCRFIEGSK